MKEKLPPVYTVPKSQLYPWALQGPINTPHTLGFFCYLHPKETLYSQIDISCDLHLYPVLLLRKGSYYEQK